MDKRELRQQWRREAYFIIVLLLMLIVVAAKKAHDTKPPTDVNMTEVFSPFIKEALPVEKMDVNACYHNKDTSVSTCNVIVYTRTDFLVFLKCSHDFNTLQTNCLLISSK